MGVVAARHQLIPDHKLQHQKRQRGAACRQKREFRQARVVPNGRPSRHLEGDAGYAQHNGVEPQQQRFRQRNPIRPLPSGKLQWRQPHVVSRQHQKEHDANDGQKAHQRHLLVGRLIGGRAQLDDRVRFVDPRFLGKSLENAHVAILRLPAGESIACLARLDSGKQSTRAQGNGFRSAIVIAGGAGGETGGA